MLPSTKNLILSSGMTVSEISRKSGYTRRTIYFWIKNERNPSLSSYRDLCEICGYEISILKKG